MNYGPKLKIPDFEVSIYESSTNPNIMNLI